LIDWAKVKTQKRSHVRHINVTAKDTASIFRPVHSIRYPLPSGFSRRTWG